MIKINTLLIRMEELEALESCFDKSLLSFEKKADIHGGHSPATDSWDGVYNFSYVREDQLVRGTFTRTSKDTYRGTLELGLRQESVKVVTEIPKMAPSLAKSLARELTGQKYQDE